MRAHARYPEFLDAFRNISWATRSIRTSVYRVCDPVYANTRDLLAGEGSWRYGGRWNPPKSFRMVYLSLSLEGALQETLGMAECYGFDVSARLPLTLVAIDAVLERVLDLTTQEARRRLRTTLRAMRTCDWRADNAAGQEAFTQVIGRAAFDAGLQGIIVPSSLKQSHRHLNVFPDHVQGISRLEILRREKLPPPWP